MLPKSPEVKREAPGMRGRTRVLISGRAENHSPGGRPGGYRPELVCAGRGGPEPIVATCMGPPVTAQLAELRARLPELTLRDRHRLSRRIDGVQKMRDAARRTTAAGEIAADVEQAALRVARRRAGLPAITYPEALPVSQKKDDILTAIRD